MLGVDQDDWIHVNLRKQPENCYHKSRKAVALSIIFLI